MRYSLNPKQLRLLGLIYKFRFISIPLLTEYLGLRSNSLIRTLPILESQGYIESIFNKAWKIEHRAAIYTLANKGIGALKADEDIDPKSLHTLYRNKTMDETSRDHYLHAMAAYNALTYSYPEDDIFSRMELLSFPEMPVNRPDLYIKTSDGSKEYLLRIEHDSHPYLTRKRLVGYIEHLETNGWPIGQYPGLLFVMKTPAHVAEFFKYASKVLDSLGMDSKELPVAATTFSRLTTKPYSAAVWSFVGSTSPAPLHE